jgi:hypothetical protein
MFPRRRATRSLELKSWVGLTVLAVMGLTGCYRYPQPPAPPAPIVNAAPNPIPNAWPPNAPPPIPSLTPASNTTPPGDRIADPVNAAAECGGWHEQSNYGDRWSTASTWWAYSCAYTSDTGFPGIGGATDISGYYADSNTRTDYYVRDGTNAVCYGQAYDDWFVDGYQGLS